MTRREAADFARVSVRTIDRARADHDAGDPNGLRYLQPRGRNAAVRIRHSDLVRWLNGLAVLLLAFVLVFGLAFGARSCHAWSSSSTSRPHHHRRMAPEPPPVVFRAELVVVAATSPLERHSSSTGVSLEKFGTSASTERTVT